jgi:hypothetical protein
MAQFSLPPSPTPIPRPQGVGEGRKHLRVIMCECAQGRDRGGTFDEKYGRQAANPTT